MKCGVFPGQGNQYIGMGRDLCDNSEKARVMYEIASEVSGIDVMRISFEGTADEQKDPLNSQLIIFTNSCILYDMVKDRCDFDYFAGHSIGELSALYAAGVFGENITGFVNGVKIVAKRGELMKRDSFDGDCLISILGCRREEVEQFCKATGGELNVALYNCRGNYVIGGSPDNIKKWIDDIPGKKRVLPVMGPFHTKHYKKAAEDFGEFLGGFRFRDPEVNTYANYNAGIYNGRMIVNGLVKQLWRPVLWEDIIMKVPVDTFVEIGPGQSLTGMAKRMRRDSDRVSIQGIEDIEKV